MEDNLNAEIVGITEDVFVVLHGLLLVATEEVHLDSFYADALHPSHLLLASHDVVHTVAWSLWGIIGYAIGVIPQHQAYILALGITAQFCYLVSTNLRIPKGIHQYILIAHGGSEVDELFLVIVVARGILPNKPAPGIFSHTILLGCLIARLYYIIRDGGLYQWFQVLTHGDGAPRCGAWQ